MDNWGLSKVETTSPSSHTHGASNAEVTIFKSPNISKTNEADNIDSMAVFRLIPYTYKYHCIPAISANAKRTNIVWSFLAN